MFTYVNWECLEIVRGGPQYGSIWDCEVQIKPFLTLNKTNLNYFNCGFQEFFWFILPSHTFFKQVYSYIHVLLDTMRIICIFDTNGLWIHEIHKCRPCMIYLYHLSFASCAVVSKDGQLKRNVWIKVVLCLTNILSIAVASGQDCGVAVSGPNGTVSSPNYPCGYTNNAWCSWTITVAEGNTIELEFLDFEIEVASPTRGCGDRDFVTVIDRQSTFYGL